MCYEGSQHREQGGEEKVDGNEEKKENCGQGEIKEVIFINWAQESKVAKPVMEEVSWKSS